jgi:nucleoredoxin
MPFCAIPYTEDQRIQNLKQRFGINGIPTLVILDPNGEPITFEGRTDI